LFFVIDQLEKLLAWELNCFLTICLFIRPPQTAGGS